MRAPGELLVADGALATVTTPAIDQQVADIEGESSSGEADRGQLEISLECLEHELVRDRRDQRARPEGHRQPDPATPWPCRRDGEPDPERTGSDQTPKRCLEHRGLYDSSKVSWR